MKKQLFVLLVAMTSTAAFADDSFYIQKDGKNYLCQSTGGNPSPNPNPGGAVDCANKAYSGPFSKDESMTLCQGARDVGPAECALKAYSGPYSKAESIKMCKADPHSVLKVLNTLEATDLKLFSNKKIEYKDR